MFSISLDVPFGQSEVNEENLMWGFIDAHAKVVRFDISMEKVPIVNVLDPGNHLVDQHENSLEGKLPESALEQSFEARSHQVHHQHIVVP